MASLKTHAADMFNASYPKPIKAVCPDCGTPVDYSGTWQDIKTHVCPECRKQCSLATAHKESHKWYGRR